MAEQSLELTLARAAAAFKDADFFESNILFWSAALDSTERDVLEALATDLDLEQDLGLDVQAQEPIDLVFPRNANYTNSSISHLSPVSISSIHTYILTAICYLSRHINVRMDILPSGQDTTLTSLGSPQRYFGSLTPHQRQVYHAMLAIVFATCSSISHLQRGELHSQDEKDALDDQLRVQQTTAIGNECTSPWQTILPHKKSPYSLPRFFSFLNTSSCAVAGSSIPRNEQDVEAFEQAGFKLVVTLIKETPLSPSWFHHPGSSESTKTIRNAFVPIENRKAPGFPEVFEVVMGWCVHVGEEPAQSNSNSEIAPPHQNATLIHCGGGKGRAGIMLAAHLVRFGLVGHEMRGYCPECLSKGNIHQFDLDQFKKGLGDQATVASTLPHFCVGTLDNEDEESDDEEPDEDEYEGTRVRVVKTKNCLNRFQPQMTAKDAIAHLRELRPGSIETVEQEKAVKAYGDWLWKRSSKSSKVGRSRDNFKHAQVPSHYTHTHATEMNIDTKASPAERSKGKRDKKKDSQPIPKPQPEADDDNFSDDEFERGKRGKKGKKGRQVQQEEYRPFVPPPAHKIIKLPGSGKGSHHQHHLVVQHNIRAKQLQLQRGQKAKKAGQGGGKVSKERPSFQVYGSPLESPPRLIIMTGLPGSGKSQLVASLLQKYPDHFVRISQDELGSRSVCERLLAQSMRHQQQSLAIRGPAKALPMTVIIDRCNPTVSERKEWYEVAFQPDDTVMVWFSMNMEKCIERASARENHPTVTPDMASKVVKSFATTFEAPNLAKENWCNTLVEVGDDDGSDRLFSILSRFGKDIPGSSSSSTRSTDATATPIKARPAFIPARALQRKINGASSADGSSGSPGTLSSKLPPSGSSMAVVEEESDQEDEDEEQPSEDDDHAHEADEWDDESQEHDSDDQSESHEDTQAVSDKKESETPARNNPSISTALSTMSITKALQFASPTGHRPAVKKPAKGSWKGSTDNSSSTPSSPKGVSFATPLSSFDRPLQKFPRTPHLFDPLTICKSRESGTDAVQEHNGETAGPGRSAAISRSDLLLPPSALDQIFAPKAHQVLTVEEKMDGANIGFSVLHFKSMSYGGSNTGQNKAVPPPKIRVQNRNHFVHPDDHWQFKKLSGWLEKHRDDILWLCEGRWRYGPRTGKGDDENDESKKEQEVETEDEGNDDDYEDVTDSDDNEYVDENKVLQDGMAPYVLYGEWLYAKHSVQYTGLRSWFVPFDLFDVKTGTFVSRAVFQKAIQQTQLVPNPIVKIPEDVYGDVEKTLDWTLEKLYSRSMLMNSDIKRKEDGDSGTHERVEGLYFRVDQGDRLLTRCKVVRPDFIAGDERWGVKEQLANILSFDAHYASHPYDEDDDEDDEDSNEE